MGASGSDRNSNMAVIEEKRKNAWILPLVSFNKIQMQQKYFIFRIRTGGSLLITKN